MIRLLEGLVLLKEIDKIEGLVYTSDDLRKMYPDKIVVIRRTSFIYRSVLCERAAALATNLDDYVQLGELAEQTRVKKDLIQERIWFMQKTKAEFFDYITLCGMHFVKLDDEFKYLFQNYIPFHANSGDVNIIRHCKLLGDIRLAFY